MVAHCRRQALHNIRPVCQLTVCGVAEGVACRVPVPPPGDVANPRGLYIVEVVSHAIKQLPGAARTGPDHLCTLYGIHNLR